ncbi:MAG: glycosyltransferase [Legionellales bacterium]|nr:glycosyltransferase [Legionellales bacterium]
MLYNNQSTLTILILCRDKNKGIEKILSSLLSDIHKNQIEHSKLEILISTKNLTYRDKKIANKYSVLYDFIKLYHDKNSNQLVVQDLISAMKQASGNFLWAIQDDLSLYQNSLNHILETLECTESDFMLMNCDFVDIKDNQFPYMQANIDFVEYSKGKDLFSDFGLFYTPSKLSNIIFKKSQLQVDLYKEIYSIHPSFSQVFLFFISFCNTKSSFLSRAIGKSKIHFTNNKLFSFDTLYNSNYRIDEKNNFLNLHELIEYSTTKTNIPYLDIYNYHEILFYNNTHEIQHSTTFGLLITLYLGGILNLSSNRIIKRSKLLEKIDSIMNVLSNPNLKKEYNLSPIYLDLALIRSKIFETSSELLYSSKIYMIFLNKCFEKMLVLNNSISKKINNTDLNNLHKAYLYFEKPLICMQLNNTRSSSFSFPKKHRENLLLTVLIPTYNRVGNIKKLLKRLYTKNCFDKLENIEVLIAINNSDDGTLAVCQNYKRKYLNLNYIYFEDFVYSAEENISRSIPYCTGEYVHILGDDDLIIRDVYYSMMSTIYNSNIPVLSYNNTEHNDPDMSKYYDDLEPGKYQIESSCISEDYSKLLIKYGITTTMAFISRYIIKRSLLKPMDDFIAVSRIYSHVFAFLSYFNNQKVLLFDIPLIARYDSQVIDRFKEISSHSQGNFYYPWTTGILKHFKHSVKLGVINEEYLFKIVESTSSGRKFYLWREIMIQVANQNILYMKNFEENEKPSNETVELIADFLSFFKRNNTYTHYYHACLFIYMITSYSCYHQEKIYDEEIIIKKLELIVSLLVGNLHHYPKPYKLEKKSYSKFALLTKNMIEMYKKSSTTLNPLKICYNIIIWLSVRIHSVIRKFTNKFILM